MNKVYETYSNERLLEMFNRQEEYTPEALEAARSVLAERKVENIPAIKGPEPKIELTAEQEILAEIKKIRYMLAGLVLCGALSIFLSMLLRCF